MTKKVSHRTLFFKYDHQFGRTYMKTDKTKRNPEKNIIHLLQMKEILNILHTTT